MDSFAGESRRESSWRLTMAYHYVKAMTFVEFFHHFPEDLAVGRCVFKIVRSYVEMDHLMDNDAVPFGFRKVKG